MMEVVVQGFPLLVKTYSLDYHFQDGDLVGFKEIKLKIFMALSVTDWNARS